MDENILHLRRWILVSIVCGLLGDVIYGIAIGAPLPGRVAYPLALAFGPLVCISSLGTYHYMRHHRESVSLQAGVLLLIVSAALYTMMLAMQGAHKITFHEMPLQTFDAAKTEAYNLAFASGNALQLGADMAFDVFLFAGVALLGLAMWKHPWFGPLFAVPGILIGVAGLGFNAASFPTPPGQADLFDCGPLVGLWTLATAIRMIFVYRRLGRSASLEGSTS